MADCISKSDSLWDEYCDEPSLSPLFPPCFARHPPFTSSTATANSTAAATTAAITTLATPPPLCLLDEEEGLEGGEYDTHTL